MTSQYATTHLLEPALDAITLNRDLHNLLIGNDTDDTDTLLTLLARVAAGNQDAMRQTVLLIHRLVNVNTEQLGHLKRIAGCADHLAGELPPEPSRCSVKRLARALRNPLGDLANPMMDAARKRRAAQMVRDVLSACPGSVLRSRTFARELGPRKYAVLVGLVGVAA